MTWNQINSIWVNVLDYEKKSIAYWIDENDLEIAKCYRQKRFKSV